MTSLALWNQVNQALVAKAIAELSHEEILNPESQDDAAWCVGLQSGVIYRFRGRRSIWGHVRVVASSLERVDAGCAAAVDDAGRFFIDAQPELGMSDIVLGTFLEEMHTTLCGDVSLAERTAAVSADEASTWDGERVQRILNGHPKLLLNKGRMGWGWSDLDRFAPESTAGFRLHWLALDRGRANVTLGEGVEEQALILDSLSESDRVACEQILAAKGASFATHVIVPVHPWQWDHIIRVQFAGDLARGVIISLGETGDVFQPQISLRTLSNLTRSGTADVKVALSILNTSAVRGLPAKYADLGPKVSTTLTKLCERDPVLVAAGTGVLRDLAGVSFEHDTFRRVRGAPYRYHEQLGVVWRESVASKLNDDEIGLMAGALSHRDGEGRSLIGAYLRTSGLSAQEWVMRYTENVVVPLYHLQVKYGIGLVAHGQNVVVRLRRGAPVGVFLKDFHGDLRISTEDVGARDELLGVDAAALQRLAPDHLIHDLVTGHFVSVLRFLSETLHDCEGFPEKSFYQVVAGALRRYLVDHWPDGVDAARDVLGARFRRVLLNKVRFKIGYADAAERPLPMLGQDLANPLFSGEVS